MSQYFLKPYEPFGGDINVKVYLSNYATKTGVDTSNLAAKSDLASLKAEIDKIDADKSKTVPIDLSKLGNVVNNEVVKKTVYDKPVAKVSNIETIGFVLKTKYDTDKQIPDANKLVKKTDYNAKITEIEGKVSSITGLATTAALIAVENKIHDVRNLVQKTDYGAKISDTESKHFTMVNYNKFTSQTLDAKIKQK